MVHDFTVTGRARPLGAPQGMWDSQPKEEIPIMVRFGFVENVPARPAVGPHQITIDGLFFVAAGVDRGVGGSKTALNAGGYRDHGKLNVLNTVAAGADRGVVNVNHKRRKRHKTQSAWRKDF